MNKLQIFNNPEFGEVRTTEINGEIFFIGKDVAQALGYSDTRKAVAMHVDEDDKTNCPITDALGREQETTIINESGLYGLVLSSKLPTAKRFKHWVTSEVLPSIRQNGAYIAGQEEMSEKELLAKALISAQKIIERREFAIKQLEADTERMKPKEIFADAVSSSDTSILVRDLAKILKQNGVKTGEKRLYKWLRDHNFIMRGTTRPTQKAMELGLFEIIESTIQRADLPPLTTLTTKVTGKGQQYFINKFLG